MRWKLLFFTLFLLAIPTAFLFITHLVKTTPSRHFAPVPQQSGSNLSSILIVASSSASIVLTNAGHQTVGTSFVQQGIRPPQLPTNAPSPMGDVKELVYQQPQTGLYYATVTLHSLGEVTFYLYSTKGKLSLIRFAQKAGSVQYRIAYTSDQKSTVAPQ